MHRQLQKLVNRLRLSGTINIDAEHFLKHHGFPKTAKHSQDVAFKSRELAEQFNANADKAEDCRLAT